VYTLRSPWISPWGYIFEIYLSGYKTAIYPPGSRAALPEIYNGCNNRDPTHPDAPVWYPTKYRYYADGSWRSKNHAGSTSCEVLNPIQAAIGSWLCRNFAGISDDRLWPVRHSCPRASPVSL